MSVYLDHAASTPVIPQALSTFIEYSSLSGNPSSVHQFGQKSRRAFEEAREEVASAVGANRAEVIFTSGGTESNNLAIKGLFWQRTSGDSQRRLILTASTEHHAVLEPIQWLVQHESAQLELVPQSKDGLFDLVWLSDYLEKNHASVALISLMWANNESGVINDIPAVCALAAKYGIPVHSDAVAAFGHTALTFKRSGLAAMSITGHKIGAPIGTGALLVARNITLESLVQGGGHERGLRSGTLNAAGAKALAIATTYATQELAGHQARWQKLQHKVIDGAARLVPDAILVGSATNRLSNNVNLVFPGCSGDSLLFLLDRAGVAISNGSACTAGVASGSHVLLGMGFTPEESSGCIRLSFGYETSEADIDAFLAALPDAYLGAKKAGFASKP